MKVEGFATRSPRASASGPRPGRLWRVLLFIILAGALLCYVIQKWDDFALLLSGGPETVPAAAQTGDVQGEDPLIEFKLDREKVEKEQVDMLKVIMDDKEASKEVRDAARVQYLAIVDAMGKELKIEGVLLARGYDSVAFVSPDACTVVVKAKSLDEKAVSQIADAVRKATRLSLEKITVIPVP